MERERHADPRWEHGSRASSPGKLHLHRYGNQPRRLEYGKPARAFAVAAFAATRRRAAAVDERVVRAISGITLTSPSLRRLYREHRTSVFR